MSKKKKKSDKPIFREVTSQTVNFYWEIFPQLYSELTPKVINEMLNDDAIWSAWESRKNSIKSRELRIETSSKKPEDIKLCKEIELRFNKLDLSKAMEDLVDSEIFPGAYLELMYGDEKNFTWETPYTELVKQPIWKFRRKKMETQFSNGKSLPDNKFITAYYQDDKENPYGKSIFRPLLAIYNRRKLTNASIDTFIQKFGDIIIWYGYDPTMEETEVKEQMKMMRDAKGKGVIGIPIIGDEKVGLNSTFGFLTMDKMTVDSQNQILRNTLESIELVLKGASFAKASDTAGSYSKDSVSNEVRNDIIESDIKYLRDIMQQLIEIDAYWFGYDPNLFYFGFIKGEDKLNAAKLKQEEEKADQIEAEKLVSLKNLGFVPTKEFLQDRFNIPELIEVEVNTGQVETRKLNGAKPEYIPQVKEKSNNENLEFALDNPLLIKKRAYSNSLNAKFYEIASKSQENIIKSLKKNLNKVKIVSENEKDIETIETTYSEEFEQFLILSELYGMWNVNRENINLLEYEDKVIDEANFDPFNMPYEEAIVFFTNKVPELYEQLPEITARVQEKTFWLKKTADIEITKLVQKNLDKYIRTGGTYQDWIKDVSATKLSTGYLKLVWDNAIGSSYSAGRYSQQVNTKSIFKYWLYDAVDDAKVTVFCHEFDGKIFKADNPIWNQIYPPNHHRCRSDVIALSEADIKNMKIKSSEIDSFDYQTQEFYTDWLDKSKFTTNPFSTNYESLFNQKRLL